MNKKVVMNGEFGEFDTPLTHKAVAGNISCGAKMQPMYISKTPDQNLNF
jgi:hypothetical protein